MFLCVMAAQGSESVQSGRSGRKMMGRALLVWLHALTDRDAMGCKVGLFLVSGTFGVRRPGVGLGCSAELGPLRQAAACDNHGTPAKSTR